MTLLQRTVDVQLPDWARRDRAVLRYVLPRRLQRWQLRLRWCGRLGGLVGGVGLLAISWLAFDRDNPVAVSGVTGLSVVYFPLLVLQFVTLMSALVWCPDTISAARQHGDWDVIGVTSHGPEMLVFAQWIAVFHQMRSLLFCLLVPRVFLIGLALYAAMAYQGHYLDLYIMGIPSAVSLGTAMIMLAAQITAALIQFPVLLGLNRAISVLISAALPRRDVASVARTIVFAGELGLFWLVLCALQRMPDVNSGGCAVGQTAKQWIDLMLIGTVGDQGLRLMDLRTSMQTWMDIQYSALLGGALLAVAVVQILVTRCMLLISAWLVARPIRK